MRRRNDLAAGRPRWPGRTPRRSWPWAWLGACAVVVTLGWPAQPAAGAALQGADTISLSSPASVDASQATTLVFDYTASGEDPSSEDIVTIEIPAGWTVTSSPTVTCPKSHCQARFTGTAVLVYVSLNVKLDASPTFELDVPATAPGYATTSSFSASEEFVAEPSVTQTLAPSPQVIVNCPDDGTGTVTVSPSPVTAGSTTNFTLTYRAGSCGVGVGGMITLTVPDTWTPPSATAGMPGYTTWAGGPLSISPDGTITVPVATLGPEGTISIDYDMAQVPGPGQYMFTAAEQSSTGGTLAALAPAAVQVTQPPPPPPPAGGAGKVTVTPARVTASQRGTLTFTYTAPEGGLPAAGQVTVQVPAGWTPPSRERGRAGYTSTSAGVVTVSGRLITVTGAVLGSGQTLTITYADATAPGLAGASTFLTSEGPDGTAGLAALAASPSVTVTAAGPPASPPAPPPGPSPALGWLVIGLAAAAGAAGVLAVRRLRRGRRRRTVANVRTVPRPGPPPQARISSTGTRPTLIVRIEPHVSDPVSTIKEARP